MLDTWVNTFLAHSQQLSYYAHTGFDSFWNFAKGIIFNHNETLLIDDES